MSRPVPGTASGARTAGREVTSVVPGAEESEVRAHDLNEHVIRHLSRAGLGLSGFAAALDDAHQMQQLLDCVQNIDATITRIRTLAFDSDADAGV
jgi:hypothetical protein